MPPLMSTITSGTAQIIEMPALITASLVAFAASKVPAPPQKSKGGSIDARTMNDIGIEPGRITWIG